MALGGAIVGMARVILRADNGGLRRDLAQSEALFDATTGRMAARGAAQAATLGKTLSATGRTVQGLGRDLNRNVTLPFLAAGAAGFKMAEDLDSSLDKVVGLVGVSRQQVTAWQKDLLKLGPELGKSPAELADALFFVTSAGLRGARAIDALTQSAKASVAGLGETKVVADAVTSAMNAYASSGMTATEATDVLVATVREGKVEAAALAPTLGKVLPIAAELGVGFNQVGAAMASMTRTGTDAATAATQLRATFTQLIKVSPQSAAALASVGLTAEGLRQQLREKGLLDVLQTLQQRFGGNVTEMAKVFPNIRALTAALQLTGKAAGETAGVFERMRDVTGSTAKAFTDATDDDFFKAKQALIDLQVAAVKLGAAIAPAVRTLAQSVAGIARVFSGLPKPVQDTLVKLGLLVALAGPVLTLTGRLLRLAGAIATLGAASATAAGGAAAGGAGGAGVGLLASRLRVLKGLGVIVVGVQVTSNLANEGTRETVVGYAKRGMLGSALLTAVFGTDFGLNKVGAREETGTITIPVQLTTTEIVEKAQADAAAAAELPPGTPTAETTTPAEGGFVGPAVAGTAVQYGPGSGILYAWGGETPEEGFDCSGILYYAYKQAGVTIPRTSQGQFYDPSAIVVPDGQLRPGDGVYFAAEGGGGGPPPGHMGIYIGNNRFIEYYSRGRPAKVSLLFGAGGRSGDYMGARRWLKIKSATATETQKTTPSPPRKAILQEQLVQARIRGDVPGQLAAIRGLQTIAKEEIEKAKAGSKERLAALQELERLKEEEQQLLEGKDTPAKESPLIPPSLVEAVETARLKDDPVALVRALEAEQAALLKALAGAKKGSERRVEIVRALQQVKSDLEAARQQLVQGGADRVELMAARAALTPGLRDDLAALEAQDRLITAQLRKRNLSLRDRATLLREQASVRQQIKEIRAKLPLTAKELALVGLEPADLRSVPGIGSLLTTVGVLQQGVAPGRSESTRVPGVGVILTPVKPRIEDWKKVLDQLRRKLKAAQVKRQKLEAALKRVLAVPKKLRNPTVIERTKRTLAQVRKDIADLLEAIQLVQVAIKDLVDAATAKELVEAEEWEDYQGELAEERQQALAAAADLSAGTRLALAEAEGTPGTADDVAALRAAEQELAGRLASGVAQLAGGGYVALDTEARIAITNQLNTIRGNIQRILEDERRKAEEQNQKTAESLADAALPSGSQVQDAVAGKTSELERAAQDAFGVTAQLVAFLQASRGLREFESTLRGALRGSTIHVVNQFLSAPSDPHAWAKQLEFELGVLA